jgi:MFS family permease
MAGPALLLLGFAVTGKPAAGSALLAGSTIGTAVGGPLFGTLLDRSPRPDRVLAVTLASYTVGVIAVAAAVGRLPVPLVVLIAVAAGLFTAAVALSGIGEGPQLTALFSVRHRESPEHLRGQIFTTAASLKIAGLAAGAALGGLLAGRSVTACLLVAAGFDLCAAAAYVLIGPRRTGRPQIPPGPRRTGRRQIPPGRRRTGRRQVPRPVQNNDCYTASMRYASGAQWWPAG